MEQVWKDISSSAANRPTFGNMILQDFLAQPLSKNPQASGLSSIDPEPFDSDHHQAPPPDRALSLSSGSDFQYLDNSPGDALRSSLAFSVFCKKRAPESDDNSFNQRHKRMMKNRESAARSRARKQAYTTELEIEVENLMEENAKLRKQQEKIDDFWNEAIKLADLHHPNVVALYVASSSSSSSPDYSSLVFNIRGTTYYIQESGKNKSHIQSLEERRDPNEGVESKTYTP